MVLWIGVDDTDSLQGMCTTFLATEIVRDLSEDFDLIGYPRLVRLNPNIPWKTRGNGAVCFRFGEGVGTPCVVGSIAGSSIHAYSSGKTPTEAVAIADRVARQVERWSRFDDATTNPGLAVLSRQPAPTLYWKAVRGIVSQRMARTAARGLGIVRPYKNGRGLIGALAAIAWRPRDRTYEILAYRTREAWATARRIVPESVVRMDRAFPTTFNNYDYENERVVIAPHSPCPVLFGIRGDDPAVLPEAMNMVRGERPERWLIFETNQGTDDHLTPNPSARPGVSLRLPGLVRSLPRPIPGGHVIFRLGNQDVAAYEPSKQFRAVVRSLVPGDRVVAIGSIRPNPKTLNLEKLFVESTANLTRKIANPWCSRCNKRAKSMGHEAGFRCSRCRKRFPVSAAIFAQIERSIKPGWYEPPVGSRRHLAMPLKRMRLASERGSAASPLGRAPVYTRAVRGA
jgi:tRNA(Ile2)-agmatinylcytidine synthase